MQQDKLIGDGQIFDIDCLCFPSNGCRLKLLILDVDHHHSSEVCCFERNSGAARHASALVNVTDGTQIGFLNRPTCCRRRHSQGQAAKHRDHNSHGVTPIEQLCIRGPEDKACPPL